MNKYIIFAAVSVCTVLAELIFGAYMGVVDILPKMKKCKKYDLSTVKPFKGAILILTAIICLAVTFVIQMFLYKNTATVNFVKLYGLLVIVLAASMVDLKMKIIPNMLILAGLVFRFGIYAYEILSKSDMTSIIKNDLIGLAIGFGVLTLVSIITKQGIGLGDAKLFGIIGITGGSFCTYSTLFASLVISALISVILLISGKKTKKDTIPFGPCIALGYIVTILLSSY